VLIELEPLETIRAVEAGDKEGFRRRIAASWAQLEAGMQLRGRGTINQRHHPGLSHPRPQTGSLSSPGNWASLMTRVGETSWLFG